MNKQYRKFFICLMVLFVLPLFSACTEGNIKKNFTPLNGQLKLTGIVLKPISIKNAYSDNYCFEVDNKTALKIKQINLSLNGSPCSLVNEEYAYAYKNENNFYEIKDDFHFELQSSEPIKIDLKIIPRLLWYYEITNTSDEIKSFFINTNFYIEDLKNNQIKVTSHGINFCNFSYTIDISFVFDYISSNN